MSGYVDGPAAVYDEACRKARKEHTCCACEETIRPGDYYHLTTVINDGLVVRYKRCVRCQRIHVHLRELGDYDCDGGVWPDEELSCGQDYEQHWGKPPPTEIAALAFATADEMQRDDHEDMLEVRDRQTT